MSFLSYSVNFQGITDILMRAPDRYHPFAQLMAELMGGESDLSKTEREMIALHISKLNDCHYCVGSHGAVLAEYGIDAAAIAAIEKGSTNEARFQPVLAFAGKLTTDPGAVSQQDVDSIRDAGWSDQAIEDVINITSLFAYLNRLMDGFGIKGTDEGYKRGGGFIAQAGYGPMVQMLEQKVS